MKRPSVHYVNNKEFYQALVEFTTKRRAAIEADVETPRLTNYIGSTIELIAKKLATKPCFSGYSFVDEMISDGVENCIMYIHNFNPDKSKNPFGYVSLIIHHAFLRRIDKEAKHSYVRHKMMMQGSHIHSMEYGGYNDLEFDSVTGSNNDTSYGIIETFETKLQKKKDKKKEKLLNEAQNND